MPKHQLIFVATVSPHRNLHIGLLWTPFSAQINVTKCTHVLFSLLIIMYVHIDYTKMKNICIIDTYLIQCLWIITQLPFTNVTLLFITKYQRIQKTTQFICTIIFIFSSRKKLNYNLEIYSTCFIRYCQARFKSLKNILILKINTANYTWH